MKRLLLALCVCIWALVTFAQKVEKDTRIIDCSDMPVGTYTNVKRRCPVPDHQKGDRFNKMVYQRFQVAEHDYQNVALGTDRAKAKWLCASYSESVNDRGKWRLPTARELTLIWTLHPALMKESGKSKFTSLFPSDASVKKGYYSATQSANIQFAIKLNSSGVTVSDLYESGLYQSDGTDLLVRCVRDLDINR